MKNVKIFIGVCIVAMTILFVYACTKDANNQENQKKTLSEEQLTDLKLKLGFNSDESTQPRSVNQSASCGNTTQGCLFIGAGKKDTFLIPGTNCYAEATFDLYRCLNSNGSSIVVTHMFNNFSAYPIVGMGCDSILNAWDSLIIAGNFTELSNQLDLLNSIGSEIVELNYNIEFFQNPFFQSYFNCNQFNTLLFAEFKIENCYKWCILSKIQDGKKVFDVQRRICGENCCRRTTAYCWSSNKGEVISSSPVVEKIGDCVASNTVEPELCNRNLRYRINH